jgi:FLVCR family MFS transporter 7
MIFGGLIGATVAGILIGLTKWYKEIAIGGFTLAILSILWFIAVAWIENVPVLVATPLCLFGIFGLSSLPVYMELGVEVTYPVAEATSSGLLWSAAQIFGILMVTISQVIATDIDPVTLSNNKCGTSASADSYRNASSMICPELSRNVSGPVVAGATPKDWTNGGILLVAMAVIGYLCLVCLFKPDYKRTRFEQKKNKQLDESTKQDI